VRIRRHPGADGWAAVAIVVLAVEALDTRTLSDAWRSAPKRYTIPIAAVTVAHLYGLLPKRYDPFTQIARVPIPRRSRA
jgi:hypothetical protein